MLPAADQVRWLQVENTTRCNAWCPECPRNQGGYGLNPDLVVEDLDCTRFQQVLDSLPNLETIQFCGNYGDTVMAANVLEHIAIAKKHCKKIQVHTHGALRSRGWWHEFADVLCSHEHDVWFAIDGLEGVHEIYRQGTKFTKVIENAKAFINNGGHATWQFIPWQHNEHQIMQCMKMSQDLGFKKFKFVFGVRSEVQPRHWRTGEPIELHQWSRSQGTNRFLELKQTVDAANCRHLNESSVYLNANGMLNQCCYYDHDTAVSSVDQLPNMLYELPNQPPRCVTSCGRKSQ